MTAHTLNTMRALYALSVMWQRIMTTPVGSVNAEDNAVRRRFIGMFRAYIIDEEINQWVDYCQRMLEHDENIVWFLQEFAEEMGLSEDADWEEIEAAVRGKG